MSNIFVKESTVISPTCTGSAEYFREGCRDRVRFDIAVNKGVITHAGYAASGCENFIRIVSGVAEHAKGRNTSDAFMYNLGGVTRHEEKHAVITAMKALVQAFGIMENHGENIIKVLEHYNEGTKNDGDTHENTCC